MRYPTPTQRPSRHTSQRPTLPLIQNRPQLREHLPQPGLTQLHPTRLPAPPQPRRLFTRSYEEAEKVYNSEQYQAVVGKRLEASTKHFAVLADEFVMPAQS